MSAKTKNTDLERIATALKSVVDRRVGGKDSVTYTKDAMITDKDIIEYNSRLRIFGLEKFDGPCFISVINFYLSQADLKEHSAHGALIFYLDPENAERLLKAFGYPVKLDSDDEIIMSNCGELCKSFAKQLNEELKSLGYSDLVLSDPANYQNNVLDGVEFNYDEYKMYELSFYLWKKKTFVLEITLGSK